MSPKDTTIHAGTFVRTACDVAEHFGFVPMDECTKGAEKVKVQTDGVDIVHPSEHMALTAAKHFAERHKCTKTDHRLGYAVHSKAVGKSALTSVSLHIAGSKKPMTEATLIAVARAILSEMGVTNPMVHVNGIGNTDAAQRYNRDLIQFLKRTFPTTDHKRITEIHERPRKILAELVKKDDPSLSQAPNPMDYLNDESRAHIWSVLEYLESANIPYTLDPTCIGSNDIWEQTTYAIKGDRGSGTETLASGGRYSLLTRRAHKQYVDVAGITITLPTKGVATQPAYKKNSKPVFFAHISDAARKGALSVLTHLRSAGVTIGHAFTRESLTEQMKHAGDASHVVIIGHKEALEGTVIVRNVKTRAQKEIPLKELASYLKRIV